MFHMIENQMGCCSYCGLPKQFFELYPNCASKSVEAQAASTNMPSAKPCAWCRGRIANKGIFANYCPLCGFDLRTASHVG